jgi:hypothetical protein
MALDDTWNVVRPGQQGGTGSVSALHIEEFTGMVHGTIQRRSKIAGFIPVRTVKGTSVIQDFGIGSTSMQKATPGTAPDGQSVKFGKLNLVVDTLLLQRHNFPLLETWQTSYDARAETAKEQAKTHAKHYDQTFLIQAAKTAALTSTKLAGLDAAAGHFGGNQVTMSAASDAADPARFLSFLNDLFVKFEEKDVDVVADGVVVFVKPAEFSILAENEYLINTNYVTSAGNTIQGQAVLKNKGVAIVQTNDLPTTNITGHLLSNSDNGNAYDGDFSKLKALAFAPQAILAGSTVPLTGSVDWSPEYLHWMVTSYLAYAVGPRRAEYAGALYLP